MKKNRTKVINELIEVHGYQSYLEIGYGKGVNFKGVTNNLEKKSFVDPILNTDSDTFFKNVDRTYDIIFIDGDHTAVQVEKDIVNAWNSLNKGGVIVLHDINPQTKESTNVPKTSSPWKGDCYKAFVGFIKKYPKINTYTTLDDTGLGFIWKSRHKVELGFIDHDLTWEDFDKNRKELLRIQ